jgi:P-type Ca2+ transporter type 2B
MEGKEFRRLVEGIKYENPMGVTVEDKGKPSVGNKDMFKAIIKDLKVLARSTPEDKYILVTGLK